MNDKIPSVQASSASIRVIVAKPGLDGHDRGARVIARALRDAGIEVIYTGLHQTPEKIIAACRQEDPDVLCLSILSGAHMTLIPRILEGMREQQLDDIPVLAGGIIPDADAVSLREQGVNEVLGPGTSTEEIIALVRGLAESRQRDMEEG
ncbi:cobalamin B12-binding domain-containing protein [bacterium]|nr:cobalamin B12-binding domain-containing protein [bacterium]